MMAAAQQYETVTMPDSGIGSFIASNMDEFDDNVLMFGRESGINSMKSVADRMAAQGRNGDNYIIHASEKEVMVPREVAENNPELMERVNQAISAEGADPAAYVVGSELNSINPYTGQREFFLKKLVKKVKNVLKKAAKIILPVAINYFLPGLGTIASAAIGAGIGGLVQGENFGEALKSAALGGITAGVASGISSKFSGGTFMEGVKGGLPASYSGAGLKGALPSSGDFALRGPEAPGFFEPMKTGYAGTEGYAQNLSAAQEAADMNKYQLAKAEIDKAKAAGITLTPEQALTQVSANVGKSSALGTAVKYGLPTLLAAGASGAFDPIPGEEIDLSGYGIDVTDTSETRLADDPGSYSVGVPTRSPGYISPSNAIYSGQPLTTASYLPSQGSYNPIVPSSTYAALTDQNAGTMVPSGGGSSTYVPPAPVNIPGYDPTVTGMRPAPLYGVDQFGNPVYSPYADPIMPAQYASAAPITPVNAARGGAMDFPRRTGQIEGPGTETSDDIPAMLSDGEFVMTAQAVRNAGQGNRQKGFQKMYDIMRAYEGGAVA
jgi:hypothetical protein